MAKTTNNQKYLKKLCDKQSNKCYHCNIAMTAHIFPHLPSTATVDHLLPISLGGKHMGDNCVASCHQCNKKKGNKITEAQKKKYIALGYARGTIKEKPVFVPSLTFGFGGSPRNG